MSFGVFVDGMMIIKKSFLGVGSLLLLDTMYSKMILEYTINMHFLRWMLIPHSQHLSRHSLSKWVFQSLNTLKSSTNKLINMLEYSQKATLIAHSYVGGTFFNAKGMTDNTKTPQLIMKAISYLSFRAIMFKIMNILDEIHMLRKLTRPFKPIPSTYCLMTYRNAYYSIDTTNITRSKTCQFCMYKNELCFETFTQYLISWGIHFPRKYPITITFILSPRNVPIPNLKFIMTQKIKKTN